MPAHSRSVARPAAAFIAFLGLAIALPSPGAHQPVVVYALSFEARSARDVDLDFFDGGYFAGPALDGIGTFIFTMDDGPGERFYTIAPSSGRIFTVFTNEGERSVIAAADIFEDGFSPYLFTGEKNHTMRIPAFSSGVARTLEGTCLAAVNEAEFTDSSRNGRRGATGIIDIRAEYQNGFTLRSNQPGGNGVLNAIALLTMTLENYGFVNLDSTNLGDHDRKIPAMGRQERPAGGSRIIARAGTAGDFSETKGDPGTNDDRFLYSLWLKALRLQNRDEAQPRLP